MAAEKGNLYHEIHGGAGGVRALSKGEPFRGVLVDIERQVQAEYNDKGAASLLERDVLRLQTVSDAYWSAIMGAEDTEKMTAYLKVWGWLHNSTVRALIELAKQAKKDDGKGAAEIIQMYRGDTDDKPDS